MQVWAVYYDPNLFSEDVSKSFPSTLKYTLTWNSFTMQAYQSLTQKAPRVSKSSSEGRMPVVGRLSLPKLAVFDNFT